MLRRFFLGDATLTAGVGLVLFCLALSSWLTLRSPQPLEAALANTNSYAQLVPNALAQHPMTKVGSVPLADARVRTIITQAFPARTVQAAVTTSLDSTYAWLQGKTTQPDFRIDLTTERNQVVEGIASYVSERYAALPACTASQAAMLSKTSLDDPYALTCRLANLSASQVAENVRQSLLGGNGFLKNPILVSSTIKDKNDQPVLTRARQQQPPHAYANIGRGIGILGALVLLALSGVVLLHQGGRWRGGRLAASTALSAGVVCLFLAWMLSRLIHTVTTKATQDAIRNRQPFDQLIAKVGEHVAEHAFAQLAIISGIVMVAGAAGLALCLWKLHPRRPNAPEPTTPIDLETKAESDQKNKNVPT